MHFAKIAALALVLSCAALDANAADIRVIAPGVVANAGLKDLAAAYSKESGNNVIVVGSGMGQIVGAVNTGNPPADVMAIPINLMDDLEKGGGLKAASRASLGRVEIGLAVRAGAPHPDISTVAKLRDVLLKAQSVTYSNPAGGSMEAQIIDALLKRPEFAGVKTQISTRGQGGQALSRGEAEMALQLICELPPVAPLENVELVGPLPPELQAHIDTAVAVSARSADPDAALAFVKYITRPEAAAMWKAKGLDRR